MATLGSLGPEPRTRKAGGRQANGWAIDSRRGRRAHPVGCRITRAGSCWLQEEPTRRIGGSEAYRNISFQRESQEQERPGQSPEPSRTSGCQNENRRGAERTTHSNPCTLGSVRSLAGGGDSDPRTDLCSQEWLASLLESQRARSNSRASSGERDATLSTYIPWPPASMQLKDGSGDAARVF
ncbi:hypothetical protein FKP32DRAFT_17178 [Trametes sanguinea]|nr:hypothetical protein FKP32DRAFT_17178 [Trametes sanguinea]